MSTTKERIAEQPSPAQDAEARITTCPYEDGPILRRGGSDGLVAICRCGQSQRRPLCDGSHAQIDFKADGFSGWDA